LLWCIVMLLRHGVRPGQPTADIPQSGFLPPESGQRARNRYNCALPRCAHARPHGACSMLPLANVS